MALSTSVEGAETGGLADSGLVFFRDADFRQFVYRKRAYRGARWFPFRLLVSSQGHPRTMRIRGAQPSPGESCGHQDITGSFPAADNRCDWRLVSRVPAD